MRTTSEILDAARNNEPLDPEECRYALLVLEGLFCTAARHYRDFAFKEPPRGRAAMGMIADNAHKSAQDERDAADARTREAWAQTECVKRELDEARGLLEDFYRNYDCDADAHRHGYADSQCRCCKAEKHLRAAGLLPDEVKP